MECEHGDHLTTAQVSLSKVHFPMEGDSWQKCPSFTSPPETLNTLGQGASSKAFKAIENRFDNDLRTVD